jgi:ferredoxin
MITSECINCGACEPECPNTAIYQGGVEWELNGVKHPPIATDIFYIVPEKCTECVGFHDQEACAAVCPVDCCIPNPDIPETEEQLIVRAKVLHPEVDFGTEFPSRFRAEGKAPASPAAAPEPVPAVAAAAPVASAPAPRPQSAQRAAEEPSPAASMPALDEWDIPVECYRCLGTYAVPFRHFRSGVVLYCPFCNGSTVVNTSMFGNVSRALTEFHDRWSREFEAFQERRRRELEQFEERQRKELEDFNRRLLEISKAAKPAGAPRKRAWIFG